MIEPPCYHGHISEVRLGLARVHTSIGLVSKREVNQPHNDIHITERDSKTALQSFAVAFLTFQVLLMCT
jgi:hypothetical protein